MDFSWLGALPHTGVRKTRQGKLIYGESLGNIFHREAYAVVDTFHRPVIEWIDVDWLTVFHASGFTRIHQGGWEIDEIRVVEIRACVALLVEFARTDIPGISGSIEADQFVFVSRFLIGNGCLIVIQAIILLAKQGVHTASLVEGIFSVQAGLQSPLVDLLKIILPSSQFIRRNIEGHAIFSNADGIDVGLEATGKHE